MAAARPDLGSAPDLRAPAARREARAAAVAVAAVAVVARRPQHEPVARRADAVRLGVEREHTVRRDTLIKEFDDARLKLQAEAERQPVFVKTFSLYTQSDWSVRR